MDLTFRGAGAQLEYDFAVAPGIDPSVIQLAFAGADSVRTDPTGGLILRLGEIEVRQPCPSVYQESAGMRTPVQGRFIVKRGGRVTFQIARRDRTQALLIDPVLSYATYLGGSGSEGGTAVAVDTSGNVYVAGGSTSRFDMISTSGWGDSAGDAFVAKLNPAGTTVLYTTHFGGSSLEFAWALAVDSAGNAYVTGSTFSTDFPVTSGAAQPAIGGSNERDAFVVKLDPTGSTLLYATYLGGRYEDVGFNVAVDSAGNTYVSGLTVSNDFPRTPGALGASRDRGFFLAKINPTGTQLLYSGIVCPYDSDFGVGGMAVDSTGSVYLAGTISGDDASSFPITSNAFQTTKAGTHSAYVLKVNSEGSDLSYSTFLGSPGDTIGYAIALDTSGNAVVTGITSPAGFPTTPGVYHNLPNSGVPQYVPFVTKVNSAGSGLIFSAVFGGSKGDYPQKITLDSSGNVYVGGWTQSTDFPVTPDSLQPKAGGGNDVFLAKLSADFSALQYSTYLGGSLDETFGALTVDQVGNVYLTGSTLSPDFPTTPGTLQNTYAGASTDYQVNYAGLGDVFVVKIAAAPSGLPQVSSISAASLTRVSALAPASIASGFGVGLAAQTEQATVLPLPTSLAGTTVKLHDSSGADYEAPLFFVSAQQINYLIPTGVATGPATLSVLHGDQVAASGTLQIQPVAPGLFSANSSGTGVAAALAVLVKADHSQLPVPVFHCSPASCVADPIDLGSESDQVVLELFGTGLRGFRALPTAVIGLQAATVLGAAAQSQYAGLDQVNVLIPRTLAGSGEVSLAVTVDGHVSNLVTINIK